MCCSNYLRYHGSKETKNNPPRPQECWQENGEDVADNTDFHVILLSSLKILKTEKHGSYKKVILDEKMTRSVNLSCANLATASFFECPARRLERKVERC